MQTKCWNTPSTALPHKTAYIVVAPVVGPSVNQYHEPMSPRSKCNNQALPYQSKMPANGLSFRKVPRDLTVLQPQLPDNTCHCLVLIFWFERLSDTLVRGAVAPPFVPGVGNQIAARFLGNVQLRFLLSVKLGELDTIGIHTTFLLCSDVLAFLGQLKSTILNPIQLVAH